jgi:hypothetical protein
MISYFGWKIEKNRKQLSDYAGVGGTLVED